MNYLLQISIILSILSHISAAPYASEPMSAHDKGRLPEEITDERLMEALKMFIQRQNKTEQQTNAPTTGRPRPLPTTDSSKAVLAQLYNLLNEQSADLTTERPTETPTESLEDQLLKRVLQRVKARSMVHSEPPRSEDVELARRASTSTCKHSNNRLCQVIHSLGGKRSFSDHAINVPARGMSSDDSYRERLNNLLKILAIENREPESVDDGWFRLPSRSLYETQSDIGDRSRVHEELERIKSLSLQLYQVANERERHDVT